jgi:hypothetical protein
MRHVIKIIYTSLDFNLELKMRGYWKSYCSFLKHGGLEVHECFFYKIKTLKNINFVSNHFLKINVY